LKDEVDAVKVVEGGIAFLEPEFSGRALRKLHHGQQAQLRDPPVCVSALKFILK
jgi:hypothetical protein